MNAFDIAELVPLIPEVFLCLSAILLLMYGVFKGNSHTAAVNSGACLVLFFTFYLEMMMGRGPDLAFHQMFVSDGFARFAKLVILGAAFMVLLMSGDWQRREENRRFEFPVLVLLATLGMMLMVSANDFMALYMGLELSSLALYVLASITRDAAKSTEAGLKYFVLGALASGMLLFGVSLVYGFAGTTSFGGLAKLFAGEDVAISTGLIIGVVLVMVGLCFKVSAVPFHMWTPDVYEGAPTPVTGFFAAAPKVAALALFVRVMIQPFGDLIASWQQIIIFVSIASMIVGALGAITQTNIKRLLAYSSIGHVGYALVGLATGTQDGISGILIYLALYIFMSLGAFACVLLMKRGGKYVEDIASLAGLARTHPIRAFALAVFMFSMAGIPPLAGFFGKMYIFLAAVKGGFFTLAVIGVLTSVISCYYYLKIVKIMYFDEAEEGFDIEVTPGIQAVLFASVAVTCFFFLAPTKLITYAQSAAGALL